MDPGWPENPVFIFLESQLKLSVCELAASSQENKMDMRDE